MVMEIIFWKSDSAAAIAKLEVKIQGYLVQGISLYKVCMRLGLFMIGAAT